MVKRCYSCMQPIGEGNFCDWCGYDQRKPNAPHQLPVGTVLRDQYLIGKVLGQGGFGITYLGWDINLDIPVAIKEYYPTGIVNRENTISNAVSVMTGSEDTGFAENKARFLREAQTLAKLEDVPEVVLVKNFFAENNTAYIIMGYVKGITLQEHIRRSGGKLSVEETFRILMPIMDAMDKVHAMGLVHRDISPDNIMIQPDGKPRLIDFGAAHETTCGASAKSTQAVLKHGYAPIEQYQRKGNLGPWTDVYAMCATAYTCLTGKNPPHATDRMMGEEDFDWNIPGLTSLQSSALEQGSAIQYTERFQSTGVLRKALLAAAQVQHAEPAISAEPAVSESGTVALQRDEPAVYTAPVEPRPIPPYTVPVERKAPVQKVTAPQPAAQKVQRKKGSWKGILALVLMAAVIIGAVLLGTGVLGSGTPKQTDPPRRSDNKSDDGERSPEAPQPPAADVGEVAVFWYSFNDSYLTMVREAMKEEFDASGIGHMHYDANFSQATQMEQIQTAVTKGASVLIVNIVDSYGDDAAQNIVDTAAAAGIPVIFFNRAVSEEIISSYDRAVYVGTDYTMAGRLQGMMVGDYVLANFDAMDLNGDGVISYVMFKGQEGNMEADARTLYSVEEANAILTSAGKPGLEFYDRNNASRYLVDQMGAWSATQGQELMSTLLSQYSEDRGNMVELVIANNDGMAIGAVAALQDKGYNIPGKTCIPVFGIDAEDYARELIAEGAMTGSVAQDIEGQAAAVVRIAKNLASDRDTFYGVDGEVVGSWRVNIPYIPYTGE